MGLVVLAVAPGIFWLWYFLARDHLHPEPRELVRRVFLLGAVSAVAAGLVEGALFHLLGLDPAGPYLPHGAGAALLVGTVEEAAKFAVVLLAVYRHPAFDEPLDGIVYAVAASLGFATLENLAYVLRGGVAVGVLRALLAVPGHAFFGALMGFYIGLAHRHPRRATRLLALGLATSALAHAVYDGVLFTRTLVALGVVPVVMGLWWRALAATRRAQAYGPGG